MLAKDLGKKGHPGQRPSNTDENGRFGISEGLSYQVPLLSHPNKVTRIWRGDTKRAKLAGQRFESLATLAQEGLAAAGRWLR